MTFDEFINTVDKDKIKEAAAAGDASGLVSLMREEGVELSDEMLEGVAGGTFMVFPSIFEFFNSKESYEIFMKSLMGGIAYL